MSANASVEGPSSRANSLNNSGKGKQLSAPNRATPRSSLSQQDENAQRETPVPRRHDDSLTSSSRSVQSPASFDFSKIDRLEESINAPGIVRSSVSNISQQGSPTLPDEKGFSLQIGAELFKLSGASIMSDGRSSDVQSSLASRLRILEHHPICLLSSSSSCKRTKIPPVS